MQTKRISSESQRNSERKKEHLDIVLNKDVEFKDISTGFENYYFIHQALPETDLTGIDTSAYIFGKRLEAPLLISSMVGGIESAGLINRNLAEAAQYLGIAMGVGSQRCAIEDDAAVSSYKVRDVAPDILLFANLGAIQLNNGYGPDECRRAVEMIGADALILHLNPLQEALQKGGNTNFYGLLGKIERVCRELTVPVIVKEVGWGISGETAAKLISAGVAGIDVAGAGGTSWSEVEKCRAASANDEMTAAGFSSWGIPTAESLLEVRKVSRDTTIIASGGIRTGTDAAKAIALGADAIGIAAPLLQAAGISSDAVIEFLTPVIEGLKISMFCIGASSLPELKNTPYLKNRAVI